LARWTEKCEELNLMAGSVGFRNILESTQAASIVVVTLVIELDGETLGEFVSSNSVAVVDFYSNWCPPCRIMDPVFRKVSEDMADHVAFGRINISKHGQISREHEIRGIPTLVMFRDGNYVDRIVGVKPKTRVTSWIRDRM